MHFSTLSALPLPTHITLLPPPLSFDLQIEGVRHVARLLEASFPPYALRFGSPHRHRRRNGGVAAAITRTPMRTVRGTAMRAPSPASDDAATASTTTTTTSGGDEGEVRTIPLRRCA